MKRSERSIGLETALYKNIPLLGEGIEIPRFQYPYVMLFQEWRCRSSLLSPSLWALSFFLRASYVLKGTADLLISIIYHLFEGASVLIGKLIFFT